MSPRRPLTDSCCQKWPNQYHDVTIYHKTDDIPVTHFSTCTKSTSNKPLNTRQERWKCSTLYCLKRIRRTNNELIGNSWSKEKKMCLCVLLQNIPHENVCIGSTSMSRSSSSKIKAVYLQLRCLSTSKSWNHPAKKKNSVFKPFQCPILTYLTAQIVDIPEFIASAAIKHLCSKKAVSTVLQKYFKKKALSTPSEEKRKLPYVRLQLCFQMCCGSGVKDKSTRMWHTPTRNRFAVCAFLTGGGRWALCLVFLLSTTRGERPHFVVVNYDTASFVLATLAVFTSGTEAKCQPC